MLIQGACILLGVVCTSAVLNAQATAPVRVAPGSDAADRRRAVHGLDLLLDGDIDGAAQIFRQIQVEDPQSPLGYLLEADAVWWTIYFSTANLFDVDVFAATDLPTTPYDAHFDDLVDLAIRKSEARIRAHEDLARSYLYEGMAYALRARLTGLRDRDLPTARSGKKMRALLLKSLELDPSLTDAYLGIGIYNYFVDTLSAVVKILAFFIRLPGGSRIDGVRQMQLAADKGELTSEEAKFFLAKDYTRGNEKQYAKSMQLFQHLHHRYPDNPFWLMLIGSVHFRMSERDKGEQCYWEIYRSTASQKTVVDRALREASIIALQRLHPGQDLDKLNH